MYFKRIFVILVIWEILPHTHISQGILSLHNSHTWTLQTLFLSPSLALPKLWSFLFYPKLFCKWKPTLNLYKYLLDIFHTTQVINKNLFSDIKNYGYLGCYHHNVSSLWTSSDIFFLISNWIPLFNTSVAKGIYYINWINIIYFCSFSSTRIHGLSSDFKIHIIKDTIFRLLTVCSFLQNGVIALCKGNLHIYSNYDGVLKMSRLSPLSCIEMNI